MTVTRSEFFLALNQVATERGISLEDVISSIKAAVLAAYKKDYCYSDKEIEGNIEVHINKESGEIHIFKDDKDITPPGFGRIAAQTARQVILQNIREAEKKQVAKQYRSQVGSVIRGRVIRFDGRNVYFDIGKAEGVLLPEGRVRSDQYNLNDTYMLYVQEIREDEYGNSRIIVSRSHPKLIEELFRKEVPEIASGTVKVFNVVREPGERAKIAVFSDQPGVDPVGACVGQKGIRVKAVNEELGSEEKIDIIQYHSDDTLFIREALSPAKIDSIQIDKRKKKAVVNVSEADAPLAIGKGGINVNLASKLTGYEIDIVQVEGLEQDENKKSKNDKKSPSDYQEDNNVEEKLKKSEEEQNVVH